MTMECEEKTFKAEDGTEQKVWIPVDEEKTGIVEKNKRFWEKHPVAKKVVIGVGLAVITGGIGLIVKGIVDSRADSGSSEERNKVPEVSESND